MEATFTIDPDPAASICPPNSRHSRNGPVRLTSSTRRQAWAVVCSAGTSSEIPALLTSTSARPNRSRTPSASARTSSSADTSVRDGHTVPPPASAPSAAGAVGSVTSASASV